MHSFYLFNIERNNCSSVLVSNLASGLSHYLPAVLFPPSQCNFCFRLIILTTHIWYLEDSLGTKSWDVFIQLATHKLLWFHSISVHSNYLILVFFLGWTFNTFTIPCNLNCFLFSLSFFHFAICYCFSQMKVFFLSTSNTILTCFKDDSIFAWESETLACKYQLHVPDSVEKPAGFKTFASTRYASYTSGTCTLKAYLTFCIPEKKSLPDFS